MVYTYVYPEQETKHRTGSQGTRIDTGKQVTLLSVDDKERVVRIKVGRRSDPLPATLSIGPKSPVDDKALRARVVLFANSLLANDGRFSAVKRILAKGLPVVEGIEAGSPLIPSVAAILDYRPG